MNNHIQYVESDTETDDSLQDPTFDLLEETQSSFSNLSIKKKPSSRCPMERDEDVDCIASPKMDANEEKRYETVEKMIEGGEVEKLKVEQCKVYLRRHGLRLTGNKDILIYRIKEHLSIMNGEGEHKYPASTFVINCKGDACTGDIVMFEQNVYEMFNLASRSATGPPCGQRTVAGIIVKESYGAAKQQHTFTIEVLWSKGTKPLPPLHPLLIKGRNLYRLKTMRQRWKDESERRKMLSEKHARGNVARTNRETRLHEKEIRKTMRAASKQEDKRPTPPMIISSRTSNQHSNKENMIPNTLDGHFRKSFEVEQNMGLYPSRSFQSHDYYDRQNLRKSYSFQHNGYLPRDHYQGKRQELCRLYAQGRCHYGSNCKYLH